MSARYQTHSALDTKQATETEAGNHL